MRLELLVCDLVLAVMHHELLVCGSQLCCEALLHSVVQRASPQSPCDAVVRTSL